MWVVEAIFLWRAAYASPPTGRPSADPKWPIRGPGRSPFQHLGGVTQVTEADAKSWFLLMVRNNLRTIRGDSVMKFLPAMFSASLNLLSGVALAQAPDFFVGPASNLASSTVGGGHRQFVAGGSEMLIVDLEPGAGEGGSGPMAQSGRRAIIENHGDGPQVVYVEPAPQSRGRHARMSGGGTEMVITYEAGR
jgi:hypothetical protein